MTLTRKALISLAAVIVVVSAPASMAPPKITKEDNDRWNEEERQAFDSELQKKLGDADSLVVETLLPPLKNAPVSATISDAAVVRDLVAHLKAEKSIEPWMWVRGESHPVKLSAPCQCWGDFEYRFYSGGTLVAKFTVHHQSHIRSEVVAPGRDIPLTRDSINRLYKIAARHLPAYYERCCGESAGRKEERPAIKN